MLSLAQLYNNGVSVPKHSTLVEMEMEMKAREDVWNGQDLTPPVAPVSAALYDTSLTSHCSSCFRRHVNPATTTSTFVSYCSSRCAAVDSPLHFSSAENNLFLLLNNNYCSALPHGGDSSDLRASLRFLRLLELLSLLPSSAHTIPARIAGFMTNREKLARHEDAEDWARIRDGARLMATARALRDGRDFDGGDCEVEEAVLCLVLTNAVDVQVSGDSGVGLGMGVGVAVYDHRFSWINHSCSPNSCYRFLLFSDDLEAREYDMLRIVPSADQMQMDYYGVSFQHIQNFQRLQKFGSKNDLEEH